MKRDRFEGTTQCPLIVQNVGPIVGLRGLKSIKWLSDLAYIQFFGAGEGNRTLV
jgi:hypothetical protein